MKSFFKKYWWIILIFIGVVIILPILFENILLYGPYRNSFEEGEWFSFLGSYVGAIVSAIIFIVTISIDKKDMKDEVERNRKIAKLNYEIDKTKKIYNFFMMTDYQLQNIEMELAEYRRFCSDLIVIRQYVLKENSKNDYSGILEEKRKDFYDFITVENLLLHYDIAQVMNALGTNNDEKLRKLSEFILELVEKRNLYAEELTKRYEDYIEQLIDNMM